MLSASSSGQKFFLLWMCVDTGCKVETWPVNMCARVVCAVLRDGLKIMVERECHFFTLGKER